MKILRPTVLAALAGLILTPLSISRAEEKAEDPMKPGSIPVTEKDNFVSLAKLSLADAVKAALESNAGTAVAAKLEEDDGFLIWEVAVVDSEGKTVELDVDAGNGKILASEQADHEEKGESENEDEDNE